MENKDKKFNWLVMFKIVGAIVTVAGVVFSLVVGSMYGNTKKIFGLFTMPLFGWIVALAGFILFYWSRSKLIDNAEKEQQLEFERQMKEQDLQRKLKEIQEIAKQKQKKLPKRGLVVLIKKKEFVARKSVKTENQDSKDDFKENQPTDIAVQDKIIKDKKPKKENKKSVENPKNKLPKEKKQDDINQNKKVDEKEDSLDKFIDNEDVITSKKSKRKEK